MAYPFAQKKNTATAASMLAVLGFAALTAAAPVQAQDMAAPPTAATEAAIPAAPADTAAPAPATTAAPAVPMAPPAAAAPVPVRIGQHADYTRIVFDLPKLTAYNVSQGSGTLTLNFDMQSPIAAQGHSSALVKSIKNSGPGQVTITAAPGATFKHYRLLKRVVVDVMAVKKTAPKPDVATAPKDPPAPATETKSAEAKTPASPATEVAIAAAKSAAVNPGPAVKSVPVTPVEQAPISPTNEAPPADMDNTLPTSLLVSTLEPAKIAVFTRFDTLWIVLDSSATGVQPPQPRGPLAGVMGTPQVMKFDGGTAYRYALPRGNHVSVAKKNADWKIDVTPVMQQPMSSNQVNVQIDDASKKAKLLIPLKGGGKLLSLEDPAIGDRLFVIATADAAARIDQTRRFPDVEILPAAAGLAVHPLNDDVKINRIEDFALVTAPDGLLATPVTASGPTLIATTDNDRPEDRLFDFPNWRQGGIAKLNENRRTLENQIAVAATPDARHELLRKLALLYFANNFGQETLAILRILEQDDPEGANNPNFIALRGVAHAMAGHYPEAMQDFSNPAIQQNAEVRLWMGYVAAATEQWTKANQYFPKDNRLLAQYPDNLSVPLTVYMAESALRLGNTDTAKKLLGTLDNLADSSSPHYQAAISYLKGEIARQEGRPEEAMRIWRPVANGIDRLFHTKGSLALANLELQQKVITPAEAIDHIDSLRFAWRGDGLEVAILHNLGLLKVQNGKYLEGLEDLGRAATLADGMQEDSAPIRADLSRMFTGIFSGEMASKITPLEAVSVYNTFGNLVPAGAEGVPTLLKVADALISMDLLGKAEVILEGVVNSGTLPSERLPAVGAKLAAIYLLDSQPQQALATLTKTTVGGAAAASTHEERELLRARALSQTNQTDEAIRILSSLDSKDAHKLKADVLWRARRWSEAAAAIESALPSPDPEKPMDTENASLVINAAVAYKLAGDAAGQQSLRTRFSPAMAGTPLAATFGVVTREGGSAGLSDRDTILKIAGEVDMFKGFLDSYKAGDKGS